MFTSLIQIASFFEICRSIISFQTIGTSIQVDAFSLEDYNYWLKCIFFRDGITLLQKKTESHMFFKTAAVV